MSLIGALTKAAKAGEAAKKTAPFYSAVDEALGSLKRPKGTGMEFLTEVLKQPGVKKAEIADRKLEEAFKAKGKMTKEEAQQVLKENPPPKLQEREYNEKMVREEEDIREELAQEMYGRSYDDLSHRERRPIFDETQRIMGEENGPQYGDYKTPGGQNYREILLKLPASRPNAANYRDPAKYDADLRAFNASGKSDYQSSHWADDPNVLAHMRVQDRVGPNGEKILHVEEIQSDWHQAGRKKGYANPDAIAQAKQAFEDYTKDARERLRQIMLKEAEGEMKPEKAMKFVDEYVNKMDGSGVAGFLNEKSTFNELYRTARDAGKNEVPDAPFKKNWHELAMKRLLNYAADNGYDSIAITPGAEQAKRYDLSKHIADLQYDPHMRTLTAWDHNGKKVISQSGIPEEELPNYIGKEATNNLLAKELQTLGDTQVKQLFGADLQVGGEGMKGFYDKILPDYLNSFGKPYGAQIEMHSTPVSTRDPKSTGWDGGQGDHPFMTSQDLSEPFDGMVELLRRNPETGEHDLVGRMLRADSEARIASELMKLDKYNQIKLHNFKITPEMRESIKQKGLPLYQQIGIPTAGAGAASQVPEPEEGMSGGGSVAKMAALAKLKQLGEEMRPRAEAVKNLIAKDANAYLRDVAPNSLTNPEIEAEIKRMAARAKAAESDANFAKFLEPSVVKERLYHTTNKDFSKFDPTKDVRGNSMMFFSDEPFHHPDKEHTISMPVHIGVKKIFDPAKKIDKDTSDWIKKNYELIHKELSNYNEEYGLGFADSYYDPSKPLDPNKYIQRLKTGDWQAIEAVPSLVEHLKGSGHDAVKAYEEGVNTYGVFDPHKIKSAIGNRGTYDINDPDITKAKGGSVKHQVKKADGGAINYNTAPDMSDGGRIIQGAPFKRGGKVNMTANRDAMFMELSNKKLKRK